MKRQSPKYLFGIFTTIFLLITLVQSSLYAQTYIINPHDEKVSSLSGLPLTKKDETAWLNAFYHRLYLFAPNDRSHIRDENGESLEKKIKTASQEFLELHYPEAAEKLQDALLMVSQTTPYQKTFDDLVEIAALKLILADALTPENGVLEFPPEARSLAHDAALKARLPLKLQSKAAELPKNYVELHLKDLPSATALRILINGREQRLPTKLETGRSLVHILDNDEMEAYWLEIKPENFKFEKLWTKSIWKNIPHQAIKESLEATRPTHLSSAGGITVILRDASNQPTPLMISQSRLPGTFSILKAEDGSAKDWQPNFDSNVLNADQSPSLFKSPWFWTGVAVLAGVGGYFAYDASRTKSVTTP
jgi:hypothetical protein